MTRPKPVRALADVAEDWTAVGAFDVSQDHAQDDNDSDEPTNIVNPHDGGAPEANASTRGRDISTGRVSSDAATAGLEKGSEAA